MRFCIYSWILLFTVAIEISCDAGPYLENIQVWRSERAKRSPAPTFDLWIKKWRPYDSTQNQKEPFTWPKRPREWKIIPHGTSTEPQMASMKQRGCIMPERPKGTNFRLISCVGSCSADPGNTVSIGSVIIHSCSEGFILNGTHATSCTNRGWISTSSCQVVKTCPALESKSLDISCKYKGRIVSCQFDIKPETTATLACKYSYKIPSTKDLGYRNIVCLPEGNWDRPLFRCKPGCGIAKIQLDGTSDSRIHNGVAALRGGHPWHVGIYEKRPDDNHEQICGGTMISLGLVVSAGHCFFDDTRKTLNNPSRYAVAAGKYYRLYNWPEKYVQKSDVKEIILTSRYVGMEGHYADDIALVRLQHRFNPSTFVRPICIDWENIYQRMQLQQGQVGKAVGWGNIAPGSPSPTLRALNLPFIEFRECYSSSPQEFKGYITSDKFCAGWLNGSSLCDGDSGGGLVFQTKGLWYLRGIASITPVKEGTCDPRYYSAFTNIGLFIGWIQDIYSQEE